MNIKYTLIRAFLSLFAIAGFFQFQPAFAQTTGGSSTTASCPAGYTCVPATGGSTGYACPAGYSCVPATSPSPTTNNSSATVSGSTLVLAYDASQKESALTATFNVSVNGGSRGVNIIGNAPAISFINQNGQNANINLTSVALTPLAGNYSKTTDNYGQVLYAIPPQQTVSFTATATINPQQLFAGTYHATLVALGANATTIINNEFELQVPANQTNTKTIVGEMSPYISSVTDPATVGQTFTINGQRLSGTLYIDNQALTQVPITVPVGATTMYFTLPSIAAGYHTIQVKNTNIGASNIIGFRVGTTNSSSSVSVTVNGTPTLALTYNSARQESALTGTVNFSVNGGTNGVDMYKGGVSVNFIGSKGNNSAIEVSQTSVLTPLTKLNTGTDQYGDVLYLISPGQTANFTVTDSINPKLLFADTYYASLAGVSANSGNTSVNGGFFQIPVPKNLSNGITIVGEVSPYITSVTNPATVGQTFTITGQRLGGSVAYVDGQAINFAVNGDNTTTYVSSVLPSLSNGSHTFQLKNSSTGASNIVGFQVNGSSSSRPPVISGVTAPTVLNVGQTGTWIIQASDPQNGSLSYAVSWGDNSSPTPQKTSQITTFSHSYAAAGTYTVSFTVTDSAGLSNYSSATVQVNGSGVPAPTANPIPVIAVPVVTSAPSPMTPPSAVNHAGNSSTAQGLIYVYWNAPSANSGGTYTYTVSANPSYNGSVEKTTGTGINMGCTSGSSGCFNGGGPFPTNGPYTFTVTATNANGTINLGTTNAILVSPTTNQSSNVWTAFINLLKSL